MNLAPSNDAAIGIFDSGFGGLTVMDAIRRVLPHENLLYLGDTARVPYGNKTPQTIIRYSNACASLLVSRGIKALVIACNTASAHAVEELRERYDIPVFGVIQPVAQFAQALSKSGHIAVIGTRATVTSGAYVRALKRYRPELQISQTACPLFVPLVEEGWCSHPVTDMVCREYLGDIARTTADTIILACTHYPLLRHSIVKCLDELGHHAQLCDCASSTADYVRKTLAKANLMRQHGEGEYKYLVTDDPHNFVRLGQSLMKARFDDVEHVDL
ncbi:MAG: glutamate racemase [Bradymonadales bacterium]|jgi:glutamate racemase